MSFYTILTVLTVLPVIVIIFYIYKRDKYEKEPVKLVLKAFLYGALVPVPVLAIGYFLDYIFGDAISQNHTISAFYDAFISAALLEEGFKFIALMLAVWKNPEFNEKFDGIVYAVSVALGFAIVENFLYVFSDMAVSTAVLRFFTAVPGHAIDGVIMGYFVGIAKFSKNKNIFLFTGFISAFLAHGIYDFTIMIDKSLFYVLFVIFLLFVYWLSFKLMKSHNKTSKFNPENIKKENDEIS